MRISPERIGFDIDGVVADTMEAFIRMAGEDYRVTVRVEEITEFMVEDCLDLDPVMVAEIFARLLEEPGACGLRLMANAGRVLTALAGHAPLTFITARPLREPIARWLARELGAEVSRRMRLVATGEHDNKAEAIRELGLAFFVDDRAQTCLGLSAVPGIRPIVYRQPWNHGRHALPEVAGWEDIHRLCFLSGPECGA